MKKSSAVNNFVSNNMITWMNIDQAKTHLLSINDGKVKRHQISAQLHFYRYVMCAKCPKGSKRVELFSEALLQNLRRVMKLSALPETPIL